MKKQLGAIGACFLLGGCALPLPVAAVSWAADIFSLMATEKTLSDHGLSVVADQDCALHRIVTEKNHQVCHEVDENGNILVAEGSDAAEDGPSQRQLALVGDDEALLDYNEFEAEDDAFEIADLVEEAKARQARAAETAPQAPVVADVPAVETDKPTVETPRRVAESGPLVLNPGGLISPVGQDGVEGGKVRIALDLRHVAPGGKLDLPSVEKLATASLENVPSVDGLPKAPAIAQVSDEVPLPTATGEPVPGVYYVIASANGPGRAFGLMDRYRDLRPLVLEAGITDERSVYRVVIGPYLNTESRTAEQAIAQAGIAHPWALKVQPGEWTMATREDVPNTVAARGDDPAPASGEHGTTAQTAAKTAAKTTVATEKAEQGGLTARDWPGLRGLFATRTF